MQTASFLAFLALLIGAIFFFWRRVLSGAGPAITATFFSLMIMVAVLRLAYGLAEGRI